MVYLKKHLQKYPKMELTDILKLYLQGILGPTHLISDVNRLKNNLLNEYEQCKDIDYKYELYEEISDDFIRVNIKPYYEKYKTFDYLINAFIKSTNQVYDINQFIEEVIKLKTDENSKQLDEYIKSKRYVVSHSTVYKENYFPHYLVINKKYKGDAFYEI